MNRELKVAFRDMPMIWPIFMKRRKSLKEIEQKAGLSPLGLMKKTGELEAVQYDNFVQEFSATFRHEGYTLAVAISDELSEDDRSGLVQARAPEMARSEIETMNILAATVMNNAFTINGYDGVPLFSANHPMRKRGGVQSNILSTAMDLSHEALDLMLTEASLQQDSSGKYVGYNWRNLLVSPYNKGLALEITGSKDRSDTANNVTNVLGQISGSGMPNVVSMPHLVDPDAYMLLAPAGQNGLTWFDRSSHQWSWMDYPTRAVITARKIRVSQGWFDYAGTFGCPGV